MEKIIAYLKQTYHPLSILIYGSYRDGTQNLNSDFDALVISGSHDVFHDTGFLDGIQLDVFVYPESYFEKEYDCDAFLQILDAEVILDTENKGANLKNQVVSYINGKYTLIPIGMAFEKINKYDEEIYNILKTLSV